MDLSALLSLTFVLLIALFVKGTSAGYCYNTYYATTYDCEHGCCGDYYDYDYGCCQIGGTIAGAVVGGIIFIVIVAVVIIIICKYKNKGRTGRVVNHQPQNTTSTVTVIQPPPYQPHGMVTAPPTYPGPAPGGPGYHPGPAPGGPGFHPGQQQYPPPPPPNGGVYGDSAYPPKY